MSGIAAGVGHGTRLNVSATIIEMAMKLTRAGSRILSPDSSSGIG